MQARAISILTLVACAGAPSSAVLDGGQPDDAQPDGEPVPICAAATRDACAYVTDDFTVVTLDGFAVTDPVLGRTNLLRVRYPQGQPGPLPVVVFSHGGDLENNGHRSSAPWGDAIASTGYVVIHVEHAETDQAELDLVCAGLGVPSAECVLATFPTNQILKTRDVKIVLDQLAAISTRLQMLAGPAIDTTKIATMGHSSGSQPGIVLAGAVRDLGPSLTGFTAPDARPIATVALSPQGPGFGGFFERTNATSWDAITRPTIVLTGDNDINASNDGLVGTIRRRTWDNLPGGNGDQYLFYSHLPAGVGAHPSYNLADLDAPDLRVIDLHRGLIAAVTAFLDAELRADPEAIAYLATTNAAVLGGDGGEWLAK